MFWLCLLLALSCAAIAEAQDAQLSDEQVAAALIAQSAASYSGNCRCPDDLDRRGRRCGGRSAHTRENGHRPICFVEDVSAEMLAKFRLTQSASR
jgi:hypothetical protein